MVGGVVADAGDDVFEVGKDIEVMAFGRLGDRKYHRGGSAPVVASEEEPVLTAQGKESHPLFSGVIINRKITVLGINHQCLPTVEGIIDGLSNRALRQSLLQGDSVEPVFEIIQYGNRSFLSHIFLLLSGELFDFSLHSVEQLNPGQGGMA